MSKKKNKFKKDKKHSRQEVSQVQSKSVVIDGEQPQSESVLSDVVAERQVEVENDPYKTAKYDHVKKDITKILIVLASLLIILIAVYYLSVKTAVLTNISDWIYKILHIQTS